MSDWPATAVLFALVAFAPLAHGEVYKCRDANGRTIYADAPCTAGGRRLAVPESGKRGLVDATVCAQLLDETRRLAAEAARDARRGRSKSVANAKRRQTLLAQYERRCAAISRSSR